MSEKSANLQKLFQSLDKDIESELFPIGNISHPGEKGKIAENVWINLLKSYLPKRYEIDSGFVVDSENKISDQIDIIIYDRHYTPFIFKSDNSSKCIPAEGVYAVFEVKSDFSKKNYDYAIEKVKSVQELKRTNVIFYDRNGEQKNSVIMGLLVV